MRITTTLALLSAMFVLGGCAHQPEAPSDPLAGAWRGTWSKGGDTIAVTLAIANTPSGYSGSFDSDDLQVASIPFSRVEAQGDRVTLAVQGDFGRVTVFNGELHNDRLEGVFREREVDGRFSFERDPAPPPALRTRDVTFANGAVTLAGTLVFPAESGRRPAIVFVHGAGGEGRWGARYLAQQFARRGFVALMYDKRGVDQSTGDWRRSGFDALVGDAAAGVELLRSLPEVDPARVGVYGHSQGSGVAPLLAARADLAFVIAGAVTGESMADTEIFSVGNDIGLRDLPPAERADATAYLHEVVAVAYEGRPREALDRMTERYRERSWFFPVPDHYWALSRMFNTYRPREAWAQVRAPVLLLWGERNERVNTAASVPILTQALTAAGNTRVTTRVFERADHTFGIVDPPPGDGWSRRAPDFLETVLSWAQAATAR